MYTAESEGGRMGLSWYEWVIVVTHFSVSICLLAYGLNWYFMLALMALNMRRMRDRQRRICEAGMPEDSESWPTVLVQLPIYNEKWVVRRIIQAVCSMEYPRDRFEVQVLDDAA